MRFVVVEALALSQREIVRTVRDFATIRAKPGVRLDESSKQGGVALSRMCNTPIASARRDDANRKLRRPSLILRVPDHALSPAGLLVQLRIVMVVTIFQLVRGRRVAGHRS